MNNDTPTESLVTPPRTVQRAANDVAFMAPEVLAAKLRKVGYREPVLPLAKQCMVDGCTHLTFNGICMECEIQAEVLAQIAKEDQRIPWSTFLKWIGAILALIVALTFLVIE